MHIVPHAQDKEQEGVNEWVEHDGLPHISFLWASGEHVVLYQCWLTARHGGHCPTSAELFIECSSTTSLCLNSGGKILGGFLSCCCFPGTQQADGHQSTQALNKRGDHYKRKSKDQALLQAWLLIYKI